MSYINMDHAGWLEDAIRGHKLRKPTARERKLAAEKSCGWYAAPDQLNEFQRRAIDILGIVGGGIYNAPISWETAYWRNDFIQVNWGVCLGTFDFTQLTTFVFLCHDARIRGCIGPKTFNQVELTLSRRAIEPRCFARHHPNLTEAITTWRAAMPLNHAICYPEVEEAAVADVY